MNPLNSQSPLTRREALKRTVFFTTALMTPGLLSRAFAQPAAAATAKDGMHLLAMGDFGTGKPGQIQVAAQMAEFAKKLSAPLDSVLALGDNFYVDPTPEKFKSLFEDMYSMEHLNRPFYACLGNHDYWGAEHFKNGRDKAQAQLDYAKNNPTSRWKMPAKWYAVELPNAEAPLVKLIMIDTNCLSRSFTPEEKVAQMEFLEAELKKETKAPWLWLAGHHPFFSNGDHGDNHDLLDVFGPYLQEHPFSLYLSGHDHTLQHLEVEGFNPSFVVSGAAGQDLYNTKSNDRSRYSEKIFGFNHIHVTREFIEVTFLGADGAKLHAFRRTLDGKVEVV